MMLAQALWPYRVLSFSVYLVFHLILFHIQDSHRVSPESNANLLFLRVGSFFFMTFCVHLLSTLFSLAMIKLYNLILRLSKHSVPCCCTICLSIFHPFFSPSRESIILRFFFFIRNDVFLTKFRAHTQLDKTGSSPCRQAKAFLLLPIGIYF